MDFSYYNSNNEEIKLDITAGAKWNSLNVQNKQLNSIFYAIDDGDREVSSDELTFLEKLFHLVDGIVNVTQKNNVLENEELAELLKNLEGREKPFSRSDIKSLLNINQTLFEVIFPNIVDFKSISNIKYDSDSDEVVIYDVKDNNQLNKKKEIVINNKLNIVQELYKNDSEYDVCNYNVFSENLIYFDEKGNIIKTVISERNPKTQWLNVNSSDDSLKQTQKEENGIIMTERHLTSPEGVKTDFSSKENEQFKNSDFTITDANGNILINIHQTFEHIADNKFISSICATSNKKDTQTYEIEYTNDEIIISHDNNKTTINMNKIFYDNISKEKILPLIKKMPGHLLLLLDKIPTVFKYTEDEEKNGHVNIGVDGNRHEITLGNFESSTNEIDAMYSTLIHELGHLLDMYENNNYSGSFSHHNHTIDITKKEAESFFANTTISQQDYLYYFVRKHHNGRIDVANRNAEEQLAEDNAILYSTNGPDFTTMRQLYLLCYFPNTTAENIKNLLLAQGVKVN